MQDLKVTLIQADQIWENKSANFSMYEYYFNQIVDSDLIILPEMFHTGFSMNVNELAEDWNESEGINFLKKWAEKINCAIYTSLIVRDEGEFFNRGVFVYPKGDLIKYDKRKSFGLGGEDKFYSAGNQEVIVEWKDWKINLQICYDLRFPELVRNRIEHESAAYDIILYVANWPKKRISHWLTLLQARAIENQCYVVGVNRVGLDGNGLQYSGGTSIFNAFGEIISSLEEQQVGIKTAVLNQFELHEIRSNLPFLKDK
ncbi:MAG: nitrilase-related carbon-nitrogen hydrolase [Bacteroidota bacterium]